jgi:DNA-binding transcriptional regulator YdaS (Cro superfamily)
MADAQSPPASHPSEPWLDELRARCAAQGQRKVALLLGYAPSVVSQVLSGSYRGDSTAVRRAVEGALMAATVACPALGQDIGTQECLRFQRLPLAATTPARVRLARTCPGCPHNRNQKPAIDSQAKEESA